MAGLMGALDQILGISGGQEAENLNRQALQTIQGLTLPELKEFYPEVYQQVAKMSPEMQQAILSGPSKMEGISTDPRLMQAQLSALSKLQEIGAGGMTAEDRARQAQIESDINTQLQGQTGAIQQQMAARGMSGGMSEMVQKQLAAQQAANRAAQMGMDTKAQAEKRALDAIMQSGQLSGQMQSQQFGQAAEKAKAADLINQFNTQAQQRTMEANIAAKNLAQQQNLQTAQNIAAQNVAEANKAKMYNLGLSQQQYENELKKRGMVSGAQQQAAQTAGQKAASERQFIGGLISGAAQAFGG